MKALIEPQTNRICDIEAVEFPVAEPLFWVDLPEGVDQSWTYVNGKFVAPEVVVPPAPTKSELLAKLQEIQAQIAAL